MTWKNFDNEIQAHIEEKALELMESGIPEAEAWAQARREFGNATATIESSREVWVWRWLETLWQDLIYAGRMLRKNPGFTAIAAVSLALGVGANYAMFSFTDVLLLRPLPVPRPFELLQAGSVSSTSSTEFLEMSYPDYIEFRSRSRSFAELAAFDLLRARFAKEPGAPVELLWGAVVTSSFFSTVEIHPALGRAFLAQEDEVPGRDTVIVLSHGFWERQFALDTGVIGRLVRLNGLDFTVAGVLPEKFTGPERFVRPDFYVPMAMWSRLSGGAQDPLTQRDLRALNVRGRLKAGIAIRQANEEAAAIGKALAAEFPETNRDSSMEIRTEMDQRIREAGPIFALLTMMMLLAALVLLVACANVAGLLVSKAPVRAREMSLRLALGAGRSRVARQLLTESLLLAMLGAAGGVAVGYAGIRLMSQLSIVADANVVLPFELDYRALFYGLALSAGSVFLFGLGPALRSSRTDLTAALRMGTLQPGSFKSWTRNVLVTSQIALSMVLLTVAGLMFQTFRRDLLAGPGFRAGNVLMATFDPSLVNYDDVKTRRFYKDLLEKVKTIPGVRSAALTSMVPANYDYETMSVVPELHQMRDGETSLGVLASRVDENYFGTLRIPLARGRAFSGRDDDGAPLVAIVNETAAGQFWPGQDPIGKRIRLTDENNEWMEVIGVARTGKYRFLMERPTPFLYVPYAQHPKSRMLLLLEAAGDPASLAAPLREIAGTLDPEIPVHDVRTLQRTFEANAIDPNLLVIRLEVAMGIMGVLLALTGLYGLMAYSVSSRQREIGIRMAIGAGRGNVLGMVIRQGLVLAGTGTALGILLSVSAGRLLVAVFPATDNSVLPYLTIIPVVFAVTMLAALMPAVRASRIDPAVVLRQE